jgi:signal transduction histidine kinase
MKANEQVDLESSRGKTDKSLADERHKTNHVIDLESSAVELESDEKIRLNRITADTRLEHTRAEVDLNKEDRQSETNAKNLLNERERSDKAQIAARLAEDRILGKERFQKRLIAEALLETERKHTDINLLEEREETDAAQDFSKNALITRDQFLAVVSHDLKNPLSSISMGASLMRITLSKDPGAREGVLQLLEIIERNAANMDRMISDLLDVERMGNNKLFLSTKMNDIWELMTECADLFAPIALSKSISLTVEPFSNPIFTEIDHDKILQVLSNLIGNAIKFSPKGSRIVLSAHDLGQNVEIAVSDNGPGIPADKMTQIFERFSQLKMNDRRGLGLGLFISKWIVEAHKGRIWVQSEVGKGTSFVFTLPMTY